MLAGFGFVFNKTHHSSLKRKAEFKSIEDNDKLIQSKRKTSSSLEPRTATRPAVGLGPRGSFLLVTGSCGDWPGPCLGEAPVLIAGKNRSGRGHSPGLGWCRYEPAESPDLVDQTKIVHSPSWCWETEGRMKRPIVDSWHFTAGAT